MDEFACAGAVWLQTDGTPIEFHGNRPNERRTSQIRVFDSVRHKIELEQVQQLDAKLKGLDNKLKNAGLLIKNRMIILRQEGSKLLIEVPFLLLSQVPEILNQEFLFFC